MGARLKLLDTPTQPPRLRGAHADIWLTVSAWLWAGYFSSLVLLGLWLLF